MYAQNIKFKKKDNKVDYTFLRGTIITQSIEFDLYQCQTCKKKFHKNENVINADVKMWNKDKKGMYSWEMNQNKTEKSTIH